MIKSALAMLSLASIFGASSAHAQSEYKWSGCYVNAFAGMSASDIDTDVSVPAIPAAVTIGGLSTSGGFAGLGAGCDIQVNRFVFGAFGDYAFRGHGHHSAATVGPAAIPVTTGMGDVWTLGARAGILLGERTLAYGLLGHSRTSMDTLVVGPLAADVPKFRGLTVGGGIEHQLGLGWSLSAEYRHTNYSSETVDLVPGVATVGFSPTDHSARVGLSYRFMSR